jgi:hypothetical protein
MPGPDVDLGRPRARTVYVAAWRMFREHPGTVVGAAALVLVPFAVIDAVGLLHVEIDGNATTGDVVTVVLTLVASTLSGLASIFYAGMLDHASAAWHRGETVPTASEIAARLPWWRLVLASILWFVAVAGGTLLFVVPGLVAIVLFSLTGPVLVREDLGAWAAMRRSAALVRRRPGLVILTAVLPFVGETYLSDLMAEILGHSLALEIVVEVLAALFLASFVGLLEVVTAHQLIVAEASAAGSGADPGDAPGDRS